MPRLAGKAAGKGSGSCQTRQQPRDSGLQRLGFRPSPPTFPRSSGGSPLSTNQPPRSCRAGIGCGLLLLCSSPPIAPMSPGVQTPPFTALLNSLVGILFLFCNCIPLVPLNLPATATLPFIYSTPATLASWLSGSTSGHLQPQGLCTAIAFAWFKPQLSYFFTYTFLP